MICLGKQRLAVKKNLLAGSTIITKIHLHIYIKFLHEHWVYKSNPLTLEKTSRCFKTQKCETAILSSINVIKKWRAEGIDRTQVKVLDQVCSAFQLIDKI